MMNPDPLPEGVSIEMTASPNLPTSSLTGDGFKTPEVKKPEVSSSVPRASGLGAGRGVVDLGAAQDLVARNPQDVVTQVNVKRVGLVGNDLAGDPLPVLENHDFKFGCSQRRTRRQAKKTHQSGW